MRKVAPLLALLLLAGCGGRGGGGSSVRAAKGGRATLTIRWPATTSARFLPQACNTILVTASRADGTGAVSKTVDRPVNGGNTTTTKLTGLPYGDLTVVAKAFPGIGGSGVAQAQGAGMMTVTEDIPGTVSIAMDSTVASLSILPSPLTVAVGGKATLTASAKDALGNIVLLNNGLDYSETLTWTSDNPVVDTVSGTGPTAVLTNIAAGTANVTATFVTTDGGASVSATAPVTNATPVLSLIVPDTIVFGSRQSVTGGSSTSPPPLPVAGDYYVVSLAPTAPTSTDVSLSCTAPLSYSDTVATTSSSLTLPANLDSFPANVWVKAARVDANVSATVSASAGAYGSATQTTTIVPNPLASVTTVMTVTGGGTVTGYVYLRMYALVAEGVSLSCSDPTVTLPTAVTVPAPTVHSDTVHGQPHYYYQLSNNQHFTITTPKVTTARTVTITATRLGVTRSFDLTITP